MIIYCVASKFRKSSGEGENLSRLSTSGSLRRRFRIGDWEVEVVVLVE